jgi:hypothetical protein
MRKEEIKDVMRDIFGREFVTKDLGGWVSMKCPLARWTHEKGHDNSPSAGVSVNDNGSSGFNCFTCHERGPFSSMLKQYAEFSGEDLDDLIEEIEEGEFLGPRTALTWEQLRNRRDEEVAMPIDESIFMDLYDSAENHPYLKERGISNATVRKLELLYDPKDSEGDPRILFPVRDPDGQLYGFSGRATKHARLKVRDYFGLAKAQMVLGSHLAGDFKRVVAVEGLVDVAMAFEHGECGCGVMHSTFTDFQAAIFKRIGKPVFDMYDNDKAGREGSDLLRKKLVGKLPVFATTYPKIQIEDDSEQGWHWLKDPGETLAEEFKDMLAKAYLL